MRLSGHRSLAALALAGLVAVLAAGCGRAHEPDLVNGKALFVQKCSSCHGLNRANAQGTQGPNLDESFDVALREGMNEATVAGVVKRQIANVRRGSEMPANLVTGNDATDVAAYVASVIGKQGQDGGALAQAGLAGASGSIGPNLNELAQAAGKRKPGTSPDEYVRESLLEPDAFSAPGFQGGMPSFEGQLDDKQLKLLIDYLLDRGE